MRRTNAGSAQRRSWPGRPFLQPLLLWLLLGLAPLPGCSTLTLPFSDRLGERPPPRKIPLRIERPEAPPSYDVLVGELAQKEGDFALARQALERAAAKDPESAFIHRRLAQLAWQTEDMEEARREAERAFELDPDSRETRLFLARLYRVAGDLEGLDRVLRDAEGRPLDADSAYALLQAALHRGDLEAAEPLAHHLMELEPEDLRGALSLATVQERRGDLDAAEATVRETLEAFPDQMLLYMRLAEIERNRQDRAAEIAIYRDVLARHPRHYGILQRLGQVQIEGDDLEAAVETYRRIVEAYPTDLASLRRLASLELSLGRHEAAAGRLEAVLAQSPDQPEIALVLGQIQRSAGDESAALAAFERIGPGDPGYPEARIQIASIHQEAGRLDEAMAEIERLRESHPSRQLDYQAAALLAASGDADAATALLEGLLDGSDADADVYYQIGVQYGLQDRMDEAIEAMQRVLEIDPDRADALNYIGYSWAERGENLERAEQLIRRALEIEPEDGFITDSLGWVYYRMAESELAQSNREEGLRLLGLAREQLLRAADLTGGDSVVSEHLGDVSLLLGEEQEALRYFEQAVELGVREQEQPKLMEKLERLRRELGLIAPAGSTGGSTGGSAGEAP